MSNKLIDIIEIIESRPGMYIGTQSITEFWGFINGYFYVNHLNNTYDENERELLHNFSEWIKSNNLFYLKKTDFGWYSLLKLIYPNEQRALEAFFELWNEFKLSY